MKHCERLCQPHPIFDPAHLLFPTAPTPQLRTVTLPILRNDLLKSPINYSGVQPARRCDRSELAHLHSSEYPRVSLPCPLHGRQRNACQVCRRDASVRPTGRGWQAEGHDRQPFLEHVILAYPLCLRHEPRSHCHNFLPLDPSQARLRSHAHMSRHMNANFFQREY